MHQEYTASIVKLQQLQASDTLVISCSMSQEQAQQSIAELERATSNLQESGFAKDDSQLTMLLKWLLTQTGHMSFENQGHDSAHFLKSSLPNSVSTSQLRQTLGSFPVSQSSSRSSSRSSLAVRESAASLQLSWRLSIRSVLLYLYSGTLQVQGSVFTAGHRAHINHGVLKIQDEAVLH